MAITFKKMDKKTLEKLGATKVRLPFVATGWKSKKNPVIVKDKTNIAMMAKTKKKK